MFPTECKQYALVKEKPLPLHPRFSEVHSFRYQKLKDYQPPRDAKTPGSSGASRYKTIDPQRVQDSITRHIKRHRHIFTSKDSQ